VASRTRKKEELTIPGKPVAAAILLEKSIRVPDHVVYRAFPRETVVLNLKTGTYHGLNPVGGRMLDLLERLPTVQAAVAQIAEEYGRPVDEIESDVCELCTELLERGLIELDADHPG
jgi:coenzyme PQQ synthesis protein D (PqqD)